MRFFSFAEKQKRIPDGGVPRLGVDCTNGSLHKIVCYACSFTKGGFSLITQQELEVLSETTEEERCKKKKIFPIFEVQINLRSPKHRGVLR